MADLTPEDRDALVLKISVKMKLMSDDELTDLAKEIGADDSSDDASKAKPDMSAAPDMPIKPVVDTDVLAGPIPALKNFLIKSQRDNDAKS